MSDEQRFKDDIERAKVMYKLKDILQGYADDKSQNDKFKYGNGISSGEAEFMQNTCTLLELLIAETTKVKRKN